MKILDQIKEFFYSDPKRGVWIIMGVSFLFFSINMVRIFTKWNNPPGVSLTEQTSEAINRASNALSKPMPTLDNERELLEILYYLDEKGPENFTKQDSLILEEIQIQMERDMEIRYPQTLNTEDYDQE